MKINKKLRSSYPWKVRWTERAEEAGKFLAADTSVIDLGGGMGEFHKQLRGKCYYLSLDREPWTEYTQKCDFNKEKLPDYPPFQFIVCLGTIEYLEQPEQFLKDIKKYGDKLVVSYREKSNGGMDRKNNFEFAEFEKKIAEADWEILANKKIKTSDRIYYCHRIKK